jgi:hypothetical protein
MFHRWAALLLVLALCAMSPKNAAGQSQQTPRGQSAQGKLGKNYPNPFNPETFWQFSVGDDGCKDVGRSYSVTLKIYNILGTPVATAVLRGPGATATTAVTSAIRGLPLSNLTLGCGAYEAFWSGRLDGSGKEAASGVYLARLFVNNKIIDTQKIFISK